VIRVAEDNIPDFIAEQVAKFTRYISANLVLVTARKERGNEQCIE
jgi:hypothetical protein